MLEIREKTAQYLIKLALLFTLLIILSCEKKESNVALKTHFTAEQIEDLHKINDFFISDFLKTNKENFKIAFKEYHIFQSTNGIDTLTNQLLFRKQLTLYKSISQATFNEIWIIQKNKNGRFKDEKNITASYDGQFLEFLNEIKTENKLAETCYENVKLSGDYNHLNFSRSISTNFESINYDDFYNQLIIAVNYLTLSDNNERELKRKQRNREIIKKVKEQINW